MTKADLVVRLSSNVGLSKVQAKQRKRRANGHQNRAGLKLERGTSYALAYTTQSIY
jgi:hypothetical protein